MFHSISFSDRDNTSIVTEQGNIFMVCWNIVFWNIFRDVDIYPTGKDKTQLSNLTTIDHDLFEHSFGPFLKKFGANEPIVFETKDPSTSNGFGYLKKQFFKSFQDPDMVCFTRYSELEIDLTRMVDSIW